MAEQLVEGAFARMFRARLQPIEVARHIARAMEDGQVISPQGQAVVPNVYQVYLNPDDYQALESYRDALQDELARYVANLARSGERTMLGRPRVALHANVAVSLKRVRVEARLLSAPRSGVTPGHTQAMPSVPDLDTKQSQFALFDGYRRMPISEAVITIGRDLESDIILDDAHVSRKHAQLRKRYGQYVLYDLGSSGGTTVNGNPTHEVTLQPGDVIAFAGVKVRFEWASDLEPPKPPAGAKVTRTLPRRQNGGAQGSQGGDRQGGGAEA
jgi:hypothetical protein